MALPRCMSDDGEQASAVITLFENGEAFTLCDEHLAMWCAAMLGAMTGIDPTPFIAAISDPESVPDAVGPNGPIPDDHGEMSMEEFANGSGAAREASEPPAADTEGETPSTASPPVRPPLEESETL